MEIETAERIMTLVGISTLVGFMFFIIWDLSKRAGASTWARFTLFFVLGLAPAVFVLKELVVLISEMG